MSVFIAYHDVTSAQHQQEVDRLAPIGFRPISLSVAGDPEDARYAAVWVQRPGPAWFAVHGLLAAEYQQRFDELVSQGFVPMQVSVTGSFANARFAAVFEQIAVSRWFARHGLVWGDVNNLDSIVGSNALAARDGFIPHALAVYGTTSDRRFAGIWLDNPNAVAWSWWMGDGGFQQSIFNAFTSVNMRPANVAVSSDHQFLSVFTDDQVGQYWARHGITATDYQQEFNTRTADGLMPIMVQAGGTETSDIRYASIFAAGETGLTRQWHVTGNDIAHLTGLDDVFRRFMQQHGIRNGSFALVRAGELVLSKGYTWAEEGETITQPSTLFRLASLSKIFTAATIDHLLLTGRLQHSTRAFPFLGVTNAALSSQSVDQRTTTITVEQLIHHRGGWDNQVAAEPTERLRDIAAALGTTTMPTRQQLIQFQYGEPLQFTPNSREQYSNFGYLLLTSVVEQASGQAYYTYLMNQILLPEGLTDLWVGSVSAGTQLANEPRYEHPDLGLTVLEPRRNHLLPRCYGGGFAFANSEGTGGLVSTAETVARFISRHAVWGMGNRTPNATRHGTLDGSCTGARSRVDGLDFAYLFNRRVSDDVHNQFTVELDDFLTAHP